VVAEDALGIGIHSVRSVSASASMSALGEVRNLLVTSFSNAVRFTWTAPEEVDAFLAHYNVNSAAARIL